MDGSSRQSWVWAALLAGAIYCGVGRVFALPASHVRVWRLAAWVVSGGVYAAHIGYEHFRLRSSPGFTALHAAVAVAIGALGLAIAGMIHSLSIESEIRPAWLLAMVIWPAATAVPAFLGAWVAGAVLARISPRAGAD